MATRKKKARRPKSKGCIRVVRGRYCVTIDVPGVSASGNLRTKSVTCYTPEAAQKALRALQREVDSGALVADDGMLVDDLLDMYFQAKKEQRSDQRTRGMSATSVRTSGRSFARSGSTTSR